MALFYRAYPAFYLNFHTLSYVEFSRVYEFPFEEIRRLYDKVLAYFPCNDEECLSTHPLKHYAFLILNCPEIRRQIYVDRVLLTPGYLAIQTLLDVAIDVVWDLEPELYEKYELAVKGVPHIKTHRTLFDKCNEEWYMVKDSLTSEVDPLVARYLRQLRV
jgi:hypothetical protein